MLSFGMLFYLREKGTANARLGYWGHVAITSCEKDTIRPGS